MINKHELQARLDEKKGRTRQEKSVVTNCSEMSSFGLSDNHSLLFETKCEENGIQTIFEYLREETNADRQRQLPTFGLYGFHGTNWFTPILRIAVSVQRKDVPAPLAHLRSNKRKPKCLVNIELFEKIPLAEDSKNLDMRGQIPDYEKDGRMSKEELKELGQLKALQDTEKLHLKFLVFEDDSYLIVFLGLGESAPYGLREGHDRFYKYSLDSKEAFEQTSSVVMVGPALDLGGSSNWVDPATDGSYFGFTVEHGTIKQDGTNWRKVRVIFPRNRLDVAAEAQKKLGLKFITGKLDALFPDYDSFARVFYDPLERVNSYGHAEAALLLLKNGLLGPGYESPLNVASDLYQNGCDEVFRMKPIALLLYHFIETGVLERMVLSTAAYRWISAPGELQKNSGRADT